MQSREGEGEADKECLVFCQLSGNNTITYYLGTVLDTAGVTSVPTQLAINIGLSVWNLLCAVVGSLYVDKFGRRGGFSKSPLHPNISLTTSQSSQQHQWV